MSWMMLGCLAVILAGVPAAAPRAAEQIVAPAVPAGLEVIGPYKPFLKAHALGTQAIAEVVVVKRFQQVGVALLVDLCPAIEAAQRQRSGLPAALAKTLAARLRAWSKSADTAGLQR